MKKTQLVTAAIAALLTTAVSVNASADKPPAMEKCYGIVKGGKNDCGTKLGNSCAAAVKQDNAPEAWIFLPKGSCEKITGGKLQSS